MLHAKLLALCQRDRVRLLFGSANATMAGMNRRNVEAGWFVDTTRPELMHWLRKQGLFARPLDPKSVRLAVKPPRALVTTRSPLQCARLDELEETLTLVWRSPDDAARTRVFYEGKPLLPKSDVVHQFRVGPEWFVSTRVAGRSRLSYAPIEIERELPGGQRTPRDSDASAESLLDRLVAAPEIGSSNGSVPRRGSSRRLSGRPRVQHEPLFERVRRLAGAMAIARHHLNGELPQQMATLALLLRIARAHDPMQKPLDLRDALWRYWVRAEVARALAAAPRSRAVTEARHVVYLLLEPDCIPAGAQIRVTAGLIRSGVAR